MDHGKIFGFRGRISFCWQSVTNNILRMDFSFFKLMYKWSISQMCKHVFFYNLNLAFGNSHADPTGPAGPRGSGVMKCCSEPHFHMCQGSGLREFHKLPQIMQSWPAYTHVHAHIPTPNPRATTSADAHKCKTQNMAEARAHAEPRVRPVQACSPLKQLLLFL